jgi:protein-L-isoaspartate(D-aspartate) O-methyltransferase
LASLELARWIVLLLFWLTVTGCTEQILETRGGEMQLETAALDSSTPFAAARHDMVETQLIARGIENPAVLAAMGRVPREAFVPNHLREHAYRDGPLPIGDRQTISQPYIVAVMTELAQIDETSRVLEIGTGSGYQAAVLDEVAGSVYSIEIIEALAIRARETLERLGYDSIALRHGDGYRGWPEAAPFDAILVTAAPPVVPKPLLDQLREGGRLVVPVGDSFQELEVHIRTSEGIERQRVLPVRFVPMTGEIQELGSESAR